MKRMFVFFIIITLLLPSWAFGQTVEEALAEFDTETIQALASIYQTELLRRAGEGFTLYPGLYLVGQDIPQMAWRVEPLPGSSSFLNVYADESNIADGIGFFYAGLIDHEGLYVGRIYLTEGNVVEISTGPARFIPYTGVGQ